MLVQLLTEDYYRTIGVIDEKLSDTLFIIRVDFDGQESKFFRLDISEFRVLSAYDEGI